MQKVVAAIPSYNRPDFLEPVLRKLDSFDIVEKICVAADASSEQTLQHYAKVLSRCSSKVVFQLTLGHRGSAKTREAVKDLAVKNIGKAEYVLFLDDDFLVPDRRVLDRMVQTLKLYRKAGVVGGRIVNIRKHTVDPEFLVPASQIVADAMRRFTGFLFGGRLYRLTVREGTTSFMLVRSELLDKISFDENYKGTGYREESDLQRQISRLGYTVLSDYTAYVYHCAPETGGTRDKAESSERMYWKAHNHAYFVLKWNRGKTYRKLWYMFMTGILLIGYRPMATSQVLKGLCHGYRLWVENNADALMV